MTVIFKYFSDGVFEHVFTREDHVGIKCSLPEDYNDPYELFLGIDLEQGSDLLATYKDVVQEIPSKLTTCFSKSPVVSPMWAHYGNNHKGFVVGFDVSSLQEAFPEVLVRDITYRDEPSEDLIRFTEMAAFRKKPRDAMFLRQAVTYHGYFSKYSEWSYEQEVRGVNFEDYVEDVCGHKILYIPTDCVATIISGARSSTQTQEALQEIASNIDAEFYNAKIGRSYPTPYLTSTTISDPSVFVDGEIRFPEGICEECNEPLKTRGHQCPWCAINEDHMQEAASNNPLRVLAHHDLLDDYMENFPARPRKPYS